MVANQSLQSLDDVADRTVRTRRGSSAVRTWVVDTAPNLRRRILLAIVFLVPLLVLRDLNDPIKVPELARLLVGVSVVATIRTRSSFESKASITSDPELLQLPP